MQSIISSASKSRIWVGEEDKVFFFLLSFGKVVVAIIRSNNGMNKTQEKAEDAWQAINA